MQQGHSVTLLCRSELTSIPKSISMPFVNMDEESPDRDARSNMQGSILRKIIPGVIRKSDFLPLEEFVGIRSYARYFRFYFNWCVFDLERTFPVADKLSLDFILASDTSFAARTVADFLHIPLISVSTGIPVIVNPDYPPEFTFWNSTESLWARKRNQTMHAIKRAIEWPVLDLLNSNRLNMGLSAHNNLGDTVSSSAYLSNMLPGFDFPLPQKHTQMHYLGPILETKSREATTFPWDALGKAPIIYASSGTISDDPAYFQNIAEACDGLPVQLIITRGGGREPRAENLLGSPLIVDYAPQLELLKRISLTITHGSLNTLSESLSQGVPLLVLPQVFDQNGSAIRLARSGAGIALSRRQANPKTIRAAIQEVLSNPTYVKSALKLKQSCIEAGGLARALEIVQMQLQAESEPMRPNNARS